MTGSCSSAVGLIAVTGSPEMAVSIGGAREDMPNVELRLVVVDRVEADRPRFGPAPGVLTMDDVERRKVEAELCCRVC